jgi:hypothetical protein
VSFLAKRFKNIFKEGMTMTNENKDSNEDGRVEVRQGRTSGTVRYVLIASMIMAVVAAFILYFVY